AVVPHGAIDPVEPLHGVEVAAGGKRLVAGTGDHRTGDGGVLAGGFQRVDELVEGLLAKRVEHAWAVDRRPRDLVPDFIENVVVVSLLRAPPVRCWLLGHIFFTHPVLHQSGRWPSARSMLADRADGIIGAPRWCEQVGALDRSRKEMNVNAGVDR